MDGMEWKYGVFSIAGGLLGAFALKLLNLVYSDQKGRDERQQARENLLLDRFESMQKESISTVRSIQEENSTNINKIVDKFQGTLERYQEERRAESHVFQKAIEGHSHLITELTEFLHQRLPVTHDVKLTLSSPPQQVLPGQ